MLYIDYTYTYMYIHTRIYAYREFRVFQFTVYKSKKGHKKQRKMKNKVEIIVKHAEVSEKAIEKYLAKKMQELNLVCLKYTNSNMTGYPDRIVLLPGGEVIWIELKSLGRKQTKLQQLRTSELEKLDHTVLILDSKEGVDIFYNVLKLGKDDL